MIAIVREDCSQSSIPTANCYNSLSAWESTENRDLITLNHIAVAQIEGSWTNPDNSFLSIKDWETDASHYIKIFTMPDARHNGTYGNGYKLEVAGNRAILNYESFVRIEGLQIKSLDGTTTIENVITQAPSDVRVGYNILKDGGFYIHAGSSGDNKLTVYNSLFDNSTDKILDFVADSNFVLHIFNSTLINLKSVIRTNNTAVYKNVLIDTDDAFGAVGTYPGLDFTCNNCALTENNDTEWNAGANNRINQVFTYVDEASHDYHLAVADVGAKDFGTSDLSDLHFSFDKDIDSQTRQGTWDIGADDSDGIPPVYQCSDSIDNDGDGATDFPADSGCTSATDDIEDSDAPILTNGQPSGTLAAGTTTASLSLTSNEVANCRYSITDNTDYINMTNTFTTTDATSHTQPINGLIDGFDYEYFVRCKDNVGNSNAVDYVISFFINEIINPSTPNDISAIAIAHDRVSLAWTASTDNIAVTGYKIFQNGAQIATTTSTTYIVESLSPLTNYQYTVSAYDAVENNSPLSNSASVTTPAQTTDVVDYGVNSKKLFVDLPNQGSVTVTLHPGATVTLGASTTVSFGLPFPRNVIDDISGVTVESNGQEIASHVEETARWRSLNGGSYANSLRSALIFVDVVFNDTNPISLEVKYGETRTLELGIQADVKSTWVSISQDVFPQEYPVIDDIKEPAVYVTLPSEWMAVSLLRTRTLPKDDDTTSNPDLYWFDDAYENFSYSAVNDVSGFVTDVNLIDYIGIIGIGPVDDEGVDDGFGFEPWLFGRAMTLFGIYTQTGKVKWLRHAHRAAQFYAKHISATGYFDLKTAYDDVKYSYGQSLLIDLMLTGDTDLLDVIERVAETSPTWNETYAYIFGDEHLWTERHQAYTLLSVLSAWETTGSPSYAIRIEEIISASYNMLLNPQNNWNQDGCLLHTYAVHEFNHVDYGDLPICSPWMNALLADVVMRYYIHSEDQRALVILANFGDYTKNHAVYVSDLGTLNGYLVPYYLASSSYQETVNGGWDDYRHSCDVSGVLAKGAWAKNMLGENPIELITSTKLLLQSCEANLDNLHRIDADINYGKTVWRLQAPRMYGWFFGSTTDMRWMLKSSELNDVIFINGFE